MWPNPQVAADLVTFTEKILNENPFLCREKQVLVVFFSLTGQDKQAVRNVSVENWSSANGV